MIYAEDYEEYIKMKKNDAEERRKIREANFESSLRAATEIKKMQRKYRKQSASFDNGYDCSGDLDNLWGYIEDGCDWL